MVSQFKISFLLKRCKADETGKVPVYVRLTINSMRTEFSLKRRTDPKRWYKSAGKAGGNTEEVNTLNAHLCNVDVRLRQLYQNHINLNETITPVHLKNEYLGKGERCHLLLKVFQEHNNEIMTLIGKKGFALGTWERYKTAHMHVKEFLQWQYSIDDIDIKKVNHEFISKFEFFLKSEKNCCHNTAMKYISNLKKIVRRCVLNGWLSQNPFANYKMSLEEVHRSHLTLDEIKQLKDKTFLTKRLEEVRDVFLFCCFTGCAYCDVKKLTSDHIITNIKGKKILVFFRTKTNNRSPIPLLSAALEILKKYEAINKVSGGLFLLPVRSNQKMNEYLKEIGTLCGINKNLNCHLSRHTFAVLMLSLGVPMESLSKMMGHRWLKTTQHYGKIPDEKVSYDMDLAEERLMDLTAQSEKLKLKNAE